MEEPTVVGRYSVLGGEDHAAEVAGGDADALLAEAGTHRMEGGEPGHQRFGHVDGGLHLSDPRIGFVGLGLRGRNRTVDLPGERGPQRRVLGQEVIEDGGAGAGLTDDDQGPVDGAGGNLRVVASPGVDGQPGGEVVRSRSRRSPRPGRSAGLPAQRVEEDVEALLPGGATEVVLAGGGDGLITRRSRSKRSAPISDIPRRWAVPGW